MLTTDVAAALRIPSDLLDASGWRDATDARVRDALGYHGHRGCDLSGISIPLRNPRTGESLGEICRVSQPPTGAPRYLQPQGCRWLYMAPAPAEWLDDAAVPAVIVEGPKSALGLLALAQRHGRRIVLIATGGCWGWRRTVDHERQPDGTLAAVTGPSPSLDWILWTGRDALVALDGDTRGNASVGAALRALARELAGRGANVRIAEIPFAAGKKGGPDDVIEQCGDDAALAMLDAARPWPECAATAAEAAVSAVEGMDAAKRRTADLPTAEIGEVGDPAKRARLIGRLAALKIPGVARADLERLIAGHRTEAEAARTAAAASARRGRLLGLRVDGAALLDALARLLRTFVIESAAQADVESLWLVHGYALDAAEYTPYLHITAPEKRCGKSRLLEVLELLAARPWRCDRTTAAALLRSVERDSPTLLLDEWDSARGSGEEYAEAMRGLLNSGFRRGGAYRLCVGEDREPHDFPTFCPKAIAGIGKLPDTVADRSITIALRRKAPNETVKPFRRRDVEPEAAPLRELCEAWALQAAERLRAHRPVLPAELNDRQADICEPLLAVADLAGGEWPERARKALVELCTGEAAADDSIGVKLLADCRLVLDGKDHAVPGADAPSPSSVERISSRELAERLGAMEQRPWAEWGRGAKPITAPQVARLLGRHGIVPRNIRDGKDVFKGYLAADFTDAWARYLPPAQSPDDAPPPSPPVPSRYTATRPVNTGESGQNQTATGTPCSGLKNGVLFNNDAGCSGVAAQNPQKRQEGYEAALFDPRPASIPPADVQPTRGPERPATPAQPDRGAGSATADSTDGTPASWESLS